MISRAAQSDQRRKPRVVSTATGTDLKVHALLRLKMSEDAEQVLGRRVAIRPKHPHEAVGWDGCRILQLPEADCRVDIVAHAYRILAGTRSWRARDLHRHVQQDSLPIAAPGIHGHSARSRRAFRSGPAGDGSLPAAFISSGTRGFHRSRTFRTAHPQDAAAL